MALSAQCLPRSQLVGQISNAAADRSVTTGLILLGSTGGIHQTLHSDCTWAMLPKWWWVAELTRFTGLTVSAQRPPESYLVGQISNTAANRSVATGFILLSRCWRYLPDAALRLCLVNTAWMAVGCRIDQIHKTGSECSKVNRKPTSSQDKQCHCK